MKKLITFCFLSFVLVLSACSTYQEVDVNKDENTRRITVEQAGEMTIPLNVQSPVLFRAADPLNAHLLGIEPVGVNEILKDNKYIDENLRDVEFLKPGNISAVRSLSPDLIITYAPDEYAAEYEELAPTIEILYNSGLLSPYKKRVYLTHFYHLGVILNKEQLAKEKIDEWFEHMTVLRRDLNFNATEKNALLLSEVEDGYKIVPMFGSFGSEAIYDVLGFKYNKEAKRMNENNLSVVENVHDLKDFEADYIFINTSEPNNEKLINNIKNATGLDAHHIHLLNLDDYRTNDLISIEAQTKELTKNLNEK